MPVTGSTNDDLKRRARQSAFSGPCLLAADRQTSGRGTRGRRWNPVRQALTFSLGIPVGPALQRVPAGLWSIAAAISCAESLTRASAQKVSVKWPNDIWSCGGKAGGILLETVHDAHGVPSLIIGIGLNLETEPGGRTGGGWPITALSLRVDPRDWSLKGELLGMIVSDLLAAFAALTAPDGALRVQECWPDYDAFFGKNISWREQAAGSAASGIDRGIDGFGRLVMESRRGDFRFLAGELVSLLGS